MGTDTMGFTCYENSLLSEIDAIVRRCMNRISETELSKLLDEIIGCNERGQSPSNYVCAVAVYIINAILVCRNDTKGLKCLSDFYEKQKNAGIGYFWNIYISDNMRMLILYALTLLCIKGTEDEMCKRLIDRWIMLQKSEGQDLFFAHNDKLTEIEFLFNPMYLLMLAENRGLIKYFFERTTQEIAANGGDENAKIHLEYYVESAVRYRQKDFLQQICECGYEIKENSSALTYIFSSKENMKFVSQIWDIRREIVTTEEYRKSGGKNENGKPYICILRENQLVFLMKLYKTYGEECCDELFRTIPLIDTINEGDLNDMVSMTLPMPFFTEEDPVQPGEYIEAHYESILNRYTAHDLTVVVDQGCIVNFPDYLKDKNVIYDTRKCGADCYTGLGFYTIGMVTSMLKKYQFIFDTDKLTPFHIDMLNKNSSRLTKLLMDKGAFSDNNIGEAVVYLVENKLYNCLAEINKRYYKEA